MLLLPPTCVNAAPGDSTPGSRGRIDVSSTVQLEPVAHCGHPGWMRDHPEDRMRLSSHSEPLISDVWTAFTISFTPLADGEITLILMGRDGQQDPATGTRRMIWIYFDNVAVQGATITNGGFEHTDPKGALTFWRYGPPLADANFAASGTNYVAVWHDRGCVSPKINVKKDVTVTIKAEVRKARQ